MKKSKTAKKTIAKKSADPVPTRTLEDRLFHVIARLEFIRAHGEARALLGRDYDDEIGDDLQSAVEEMVAASLREIKTIRDAIPADVMNAKLGGA